MEDKKPVDSSALLLGDRPFRFLCLLASVGFTAFAGTMEDNKPVDSSDSSLDGPKRSLTFSGALFLGLPNSATCLYGHASMMDLG
jgi:hypothetical protein